MADRGGYRGQGRRGRGDYGGGRGSYGGRGEPAGGSGQLEYGGRGDFGGRGRGDFGGRGRGDDFGGRGRGDFGGRGRGDFGGRGRGDFGGRGRGDFGGRGRGDFGGRGSGRGRGGGLGGGQLLPFRDAEEGTAARPGRRLPMMTSQQAAENLTKLISGLDTTLTRVAAVRPPRPGHGTAGRPTQVYANHFSVKCTLQQAAHYDIEITSGKKEEASGPPRKGGRPEKPMPTELLRRVMRDLATQQGWAPGDWVYDGRKNLYCPNKLLPQRAEYEVAIEEEGKRKLRNFQIAVAYVASVNIMQLLNAVKASSGLEIPQDAIQVLDVALKQGAADSALCTTASRNFFFEGSGSFPISGGAEVWLGYKQSLRPCENGLTLNIDVAATAFLQPVPVLQHLSNILRKREDLLTLDDRNDLRKAQKAVVGLKVTTIHGNTKRKYKVKAIKAEGGAAGTMFHNEAEGREMSVAEYFEGQYQVRLRFPRHPLLNVGTPVKAVLLPMEMCNLAPGQRQLKLDARQTADMIKITAQRPEERGRRITKALNEDSKLPTDPVVQAFGMQVSPKMELVNARMLPAPSLKYSRDFGVPRDGAWNLRDGVQFHQCSTIESYALVSFASERDVGGPRPEGYPAFISHLLRKLWELGLRTPDPDNLPPVVYHDGRNKFPGETLAEAARLAHQHFKKTPNIIFVLLPDNSATNGYTEVKRASDSYLGIPSQCFAANKAKIGEFNPRGREQYLANIGMKVNAKLNGTNVVLSKSLFPWMDRPYMVFGADVTHSRSFDASEPSVAAVVGSVNASCTRYSARVKMQGHRVEMIQDLRQIIKELLLAFYQYTNKKKPERLVFYRDGVSEGQFAEVQRLEIPQIVAACRALSEDYTPPLTFVVAQKRHNTRFFPTRESDKSGNVLPGLVVDSKVVHPTDFSFYLNSQAGLQGTSKPCHYHVLLDQNKFTADELQTFTNSLCYLYCRCSKSVSIVIPAYYAHLAAFRGRAMLAHSATSSDSESMASGASGRAHHFAEFADIHQNLNNCMFYV